MAENPEWLEAHWAEIFNMERKKITWSKKQIEKVEILTYYDFDRLIFYKIYELHKIIKNRGL